MVEEERFALRVCNLTGTELEVHLPKSNFCAAGVVSLPGCVGRRAASTRPVLVPIPIGGNGYMVAVSAAPCLQDADSQMMENFGRTALVGKTLSY
jgi:hypothetical protein